MFYYMISYTFDFVDVLCTCVIDDAVLHLQRSSMLQFVITTKCTLSKKTNIGRCIHNQTPSKNGKGRCAYIHDNVYVLG